ncbi:malic enzyme-like NAD(P)-binding protein [Shewanella sp. 1_MG-2023]|uniref:Malate dehydrogenase n=1 Tax=Shewanella electrodiphila TaxID=934143 RepID=A0ABT0KR70_9GAMM|nr:MULTISPECIES: malic enzyme-like NAD(P)-binding protein [Shewanella]MCC4832969.1 malate dehydrogenase [Shewanella sp. 10N.7]MCL1046348.1 malate dehydrogenase [Shewanella electrodiphila]MDO6610571.1 malic enzyme-like NAD(P)-binding protein [Shewanella sp. 7_MG-2023]MDO6770696.1 malic enzyme-like NAD(P)-binding protein [Shewanella sp. 2_MG-2023]MDO6793286.1 malic enzyme-like NAD(P)-binding protein [Shewanella sp. 1_MG-2023]
MSDFRQQALDYHEFPIAGKTAVSLTKPAQTSHDLSLAYSPGVAEPVREIAANPDDAYRYTNKGNTVAVISNGTAILGLGNLGPLASKPVMEGKALLFKRFANIDSTDIEVKHRTTADFINTVESIADTFGGINLEDIKAPECFEIERELIARCNVPVFHDDQHGTAIVTTAGMINALEIQGKKIEDAVFVCLGAGAAAIACMTMMVKCGAQRENVYMLDRQGVIHTRREDINEYKALFANNTDKRTLQDVIKDADAFLGLSGADLLTADDIALMAPNPVIFACSNPDPEIKPELAHATRSDLIMGTGRSDYPNQVNNVLCFPFIFRGALDVRASEINDEMKIAAVKALAAIAKEPVPAEVLAAYPDVNSMSFGPEYVLPKPMDPRLLKNIASAVSQAAIDSGVAVLNTVPTEYKL